MDNLNLTNRVIQDIAICLRDLGADGIVYESANVYFPNTTDVHSVDLIGSRKELNFQIMIGNSDFLINVPLKSKCSIKDTWIDLEFPNGDFFVIRLKKEVEKLSYLGLNNLHIYPNYGITQ